MPKKPPDDGPKTEMLKVGGEPDEPAEPASSDDAPGATAFLNVERPAAPARRRAAPRLDDEPAEQPTVQRPAARKPAPAALVKAPPQAPVRVARPQSPATEFLDIKNVPTPEELRQQEAKRAAQAGHAPRKKMPEEIEVPVEHLHEQIHEKAHHEGGSFNMWVALSSAILAVLAAVSALFSGHWANEAMIEQIKSSDQWSFYQAKSIKSSVLQGKIELLQGFGKAVSAEDEDKIKRYEKEQKEIQHKAKELEHASHHYLEQHQVMARTVTLMQISIALSAIAVLTRRKVLWYMSLVGGTAGLVILVQALLLKD